MIRALRPGWLFMVVVCFCLFLRMPDTSRVRLFAGCRVWMGVTGLLFENYIVDASILKIIKCNFRKTW